MKKLLLLALLATPAVASDFCTQAAETSKNIMVMRQAGTSAEALLKMTEGLPANTKKILEQIIYDAYSYPSVSSAENKVKMYDDFKDRWYIKCVEGSK